MRHSQAMVAVLVAFALGLSAAGFSRTEAEERPGTLADLPEAVQATLMDELLREMFDLEISRDEEEDGIVYEIEFEHGDIEVELEISAAGELLDKEVSHEDEDDGEDDDDEDDDEDDDVD